MENSIGHVFLTTPATEKIISEMNRAVDKNEWIALFGDYGTGKTEIKNYLISEWERRKDRFCVIQFPTFRANNSRVNKIMKWMLEQLTPDAHIPADIELKAERLRTALMRAHNAKRRVVLVLEDVGSIHEHTFRELKKIHELTGLSQKNLFSILMFGNESRVTSRVLRGDEIGLRCRSLYTPELTDAEMITFAEKRFGLSFPQGREGQQVRGYFVRNVKRTPLAIKSVSERLFMLKGFTGEVSMSSLIKSRVMEAKLIKEQTAKYGITSLDIQAELSKQGKRVSDSTIRHVLNDKPGYKDDLAAEILGAAENLVQKAESKRGTEKAVNS
jgi:hypothetical protein